MIIGTFRSVFWLRPFGFREHQLVQGHKTPSEEKQCQTLRRQSKVVFVSDRTRFVDDVDSF